MTVKEAAQLVIQSSGIPESGKIFVLDMGEPVKIIHLARKMVELSGLTWQSNGKKKPDIEIKIIGLRPGEKLFEELIIGDKFKKTIHPKIISIEEDFLQWEKLKRHISEFSEELTFKNKVKTKKILKELVRDFNSKVKVHKNGF